LKSYQDRRLEDLLSEGADALRQGQAGHAADVFSRALLVDPQNPGARAGAEQARAAVAEAQRLSEADVAPAAEGPARGAFAEGRRSGEGHEARFPWPAEAPGRAGRWTWSRLAVAAAWTAGFGLLATGVASSWENLVVSLERTPMPHAEAAAPVTTAPRTTRGERLLLEARRGLDAGDPAAALAALDQVTPDEPAYPLARKLRAEAEELQRAGGPRR
jgi:hypothetical protein